MQMNELLARQGITKYKLSKISGIPYTTVHDICSEKTLIGKCTAETVYKLAKELNISMEELMQGTIKGSRQMEYRSSFETFKSNVCHRVKDMGDLDFITVMLKTDEIKRYFNKKWYPESLYLLAMTDYLSRENDLPIWSAYNDIRTCRLTETIFPTSVVAAAAVTKNTRWKEESLQRSIPEFKRFNIVESEIRNVF